MIDTQWSEHLQGHILPFWTALRDHARGGWYGEVDAELTLHPDAPKGCILHSRILWTYATAARVTGKAEYRECAEAALTFLRRFEDAERGGVYWSLTADGQPFDRTKHTYCQAFAIYGLAAWVRLTGDPDALAMAMRLFRVIQGRCTDPDGYGEAYNADFTPQDNEKLADGGITARRTMNTLLHVIEAYAELYRACGDEDVRRAGEACLQLVLRRVYSPEKRRLEVFLDEAYRPVADMQSYGHDVEASWLLWDAACVLLPGDALPPYRDMCLALAGSVYERAFTEDGLLNEIIAGQVNTERVWWVQAEAILGFVNAHALTGDTRYADAARSLWQYIQRCIVDRRPGGEWLWYVDEHHRRIPDKPMAGEWKCPYHNGRLCLRMMEQAAAHKGA